MVVFVKQLVDGQEWRGSQTSSWRDRPSHPFNRQEDSGALGTACLPRNRRATLLNNVVAAEILPRLAQVRRGMHQSNRRTGRDYRS